VSSDAFFMLQQIQCSAFLSEHFCALLDILGGRSARWLALISIWQILSEEERGKCMALLLGT
jgi:hypothetical protein